MHDDHRRRPEESIGPERADATRTETGDATRTETGDATRTETGDATRTETGDATVLALRPHAMRARARARIIHPAGTRRPSVAEVVSLSPALDRERLGARAEDGSLVTEYGLLAVVAATIASVVIAWASNGALVTLFNALLRQARGLVGA